MYHNQPSLSLSVTSSIFVFFGENSTLLRKLGLYTKNHIPQNLGYYYVITDIGQSLISRCNRDFVISQIPKLYHRIFGISKLPISWKYLRFCVRSDHHNVFYDLIKNEMPENMFFICTYIRYF